MSKSFDEIFAESNQYRATISVDINDLTDDAYYRGIDAGKILERSRIINLLESSESTCSPWAIALIKEETNE